MKSMQEIFEDTLELDEIQSPDAEGGVRYKPGTELTVDQEGEKIKVTVIEFMKKDDKVKVKDSQGNEHFFPTSAIVK